MSPKPVDESTARAPDGEEPGGADSFDALLRQAAHVSGPAARSGARLPAGTVLAGGRLSLLRPIGEGGMGIVYEAFDAERGARVALKTLSRLDPASVYRLKNEFRALADVTHDNLVRLHELFAEGELWFFTMELVDGERFDRWVRPDPAACDEARLRAALSQLVSALGAIHDAGKLHRDLKPSNVLVTADGRVVVLDFGLAVDPELGGVGQTVADQSVSGTPAYMAPEQAGGAPATAASDFYAIGAMLFEALTGRLPFEGRSGEMLAAKQLRTAPRAAELTPEAPADLDALCTRLLAREPAARPGAAELATQLGAGTAVPDPRGRQRASLAPAAPELLGRDPELALLRGAFAATLAGKPVVQFVAGESGMGKSALVSAFVDELRAHGRATVLAGRCYERENVPYKGFDALVDELSRHLRKLSGQEAAALLPREVYALARIFPVLDRIPVVASAPKKDVPDPQDLKQRAFAAFGELLARMRDRSPLVLVIDDLQWIDQDSMRFMRALLVYPDPPPVMVLCMHRSEGAQENALLQAVLEGAHDNAALEVRRLALAPLPQDALVTLAQRLLPSGTDTGTAEAFAAESQGSPFFATELARAARLQAAGGAKLSLAQAVSLHVASLPAEAQRLLGLLALAGQPLSPQLAIDAAGLSDGHAQLDLLRGEQLVRVSFDGDGGRRVECYHDKIREHATAALDALHARELALGLSRALLAAPAADHELVARMLELAGMPEQAAEHAARAAERAFGALAFKHAATLYGKALAHGRFEPARALELQVAMAEALAHAGQGVPAAEAFLTAADGAAGDAKHELMRKAGEHYLLCGELERGRAMLACALQQVGIGFPRNVYSALALVAWSRARLRLRGLRYTARTHHDPAILRRLELLRVLTHSLVRSDQLRAAHFSARWMLCALDAGHEVELGRALAWHLMFASTMGSSVEEVASIQALCAGICERTQDPQAVYWLDYTVGVHLIMRMGDPAAALVHFDRARATLDANPDPTASYDRSWHQFFRAESLITCGRITEGDEIAQAELEHVLARGDHTVSIPLAMSAIWGCLAADRPEQAMRLRESAAASLFAGEITVSETLWLAVEYMPALYRGRPLEAWRATAERRARYLKSFQGRFIMPGVLEAMTCGLAADAARQTESPAERRALVAQARRLARRGRAAQSNTATPSIDAVLACLRGDRDGAIAALRARLAEPVAPYMERVLRRRLGELLGGDEGAALIADADALMRAGGVVDPARFAATMAPGLELPEVPAQLGPGA